jgi:hypothetical protein
MPEEEISYFVKLKNIFVSTNLLQTELAPQR